MEQNPWCTIRTPTPKIVALLDEQAAANGDKRELFLEWRYVCADGNAKSWDEFKSEPVKGDMDLYPVTYRVVANDTSDPASPVTMTAQLKWLLDPAAANTVDNGADKAPFKGLLCRAVYGNATDRYGNAGKLRPWCRGRFCGGRACEWQVCLALQSGFGWRLVRPGQPSGVQEDRRRRAKIPVMPCSTLPRLMR